MNYTPIHAIEIDAWIRQHLTQGPVATHLLRETPANVNTEIDDSSEALESSETYVLFASSHHSCPDKQPTSQMTLTIFPQNHTKHSLPSSLQLYLETLNKLFQPTKAATTKIPRPIENAADGHNTQPQTTTIHPIPTPPHSWKTLQARILSLPPELSTIIMTHLFTTVFGPRSVHPNTDDPIAPTFLALNKCLLTHYKHIYWSQNTWIVPPGPAHESMRFMTQPPFDTATTQFSRQIPNTTSFGIRRLELRFSKEDLPSELWERKFERRAVSATHEEPSKSQTTNTDADNPETDQHDSTITSLTSFDKYKEDCKLLSASLVQLWRDKYDRLTFLDLEYLKLDMRGAVGPDGVFLGREVVEGGLPFSPVGGGEGGGEGGRRNRVLEVVARTGGEERAVKGAVGGW